MSIRTRIIGDFEHHLTEIRKKLETEENSQNAIGFRSIAFEKTFREYTDLLEELERCQAYHELDNITDLTNENRSIQDKYLMAKLQLADLLPDHEVTLNASFFPTANRNFNEATVETNANNNATGVRLPNIQLSYFDGKYEEWPEFKDLFMSLMKRYRGDDVEKLTHLKNYLRGEARNVIQHLGIKNGNYEIALELLTTQYENKSAIIDSHLKNLFETPSILHTSAQTIRHALTVTRGCLAAINNMDVLTEAWDPIIVFLLRDKLNPELRSKWEEQRKGSSTPATLKEIFEFLEIRYKIISAMPIKRVTTRPSLTPEFKPKSVKAFVNKSESIETPESKQDEVSEHHLATNEESDDEKILISKKSEKCGICNEPHRTFTCPKLTANATDALKMVEEKQLCVNCLYKHNVKDCTSRYTCRKCQAMHNTLLHRALTVDSENESINHIHHRTRALLATAIIPIYSTDDDPTFIRALIDPGSTTDLLTERAAQLLHSEKRRVHIPLFGVGNKQTETAKYMANITI